MPFGLPVRSELPHERGKNVMPAGKDQSCLIRKEREIRSKSWPKANELAR